MVKKIRDKGADYVIGLKDNQPTLRKEAEEYFVSALETPQFFPHVSHTVTYNQGHGRIETRVYYLTTDPDLLNLYTEWRDLNGLGMMKSRVIQNETMKEEIHYYISSLTDVNEFSKAARSHWGVENSFHWCLDVTFGKIIQECGKIIRPKLCCCQAYGFFPKLCVNAQSV